jgi:hypothetical protein
MKIDKIYIFGLSIVVVGGSCREVYIPKDVNSSDKIPVIQGIIIENEVPTVKLSWALEYKDQVPVYIGGAEVYVLDNIGDTSKLEETSAGKYTTFSGAFKGIKGHFYSLRVKLQNGNEYASSPVLLENNPFIDSLYANPITRTAYTYNAANEPVAEDQVGLKILADLSINSDSLHYYRFNTTVVKEMQYSVDISLPSAHSIFLWDVNTLDNDYSVGLTVPQNSKQVLREHNVGFLRYYYDATLEGPRSTAPFTVAWVLTFNVYSISAEVYDYYNSIAQQLNSNDQMFAPIPSQVKSNIHSINNPNNAVIGVFEASSVTTMYKAFHWVELKIYEAKDISSFPNVHGGSMEKFTPDWWISF